MSKLDQIMNAGTVLAQTFSEAATGSLSKAAGYDGQIYGAGQSATTATPGIKNDGLNLG